MLKKSHGFTVIELTLAIAVIGFASVLFFIQKHNIEIVANDDNEKTAINAMFYSLEEVFYPTYKYYPQTISTDNLKSVDPALFTDPNGVKLGTAGSLYLYTPTNCSNGQCKSYTLKAALSNESDYYTKASRNN